MIGPVRIGRDLPVLALDLLAEGGGVDDNLKSRMIGHCSFPFMNRANRAFVVIRRSSGPDGDRQSCCAPLRKALFQSANLESSLAKRGNCLVRQHAIVTAAVSNDFLRRVELRETRLQLSQWDVHRAGHVS